MAIKGTQGTITYRKMNGIDVAIKRPEVDELSIELEKRVLQQIHSECPEVSAYFPKCISFSTRRLVMSKINGLEFEEFIHYTLKPMSKGPARRKAQQILNSLCCITLCALEYVRRKIGIVHNDLHTSNVMIIHTENNEATFDFGEKRYAFKTYGYLPVVIDFGFAHIEGCVLGSFQNSCIGYSVEEQDPLADARILLTTAKYKHVHAIFGCLDLTEDGWFKKYTFCNVYNELYDIGCIKISSYVDARLTLIASKMGDLSAHVDKEPCSSTCHFNNKIEHLVFSDDEVELDDEEEERQDTYVKEDKPPICECTKRVKQLMRELKEKKVITNSLIIRAVDAFKPFFTRSLAHNRMLKKEVYAKLNVKNNLDVVDYILEH